MIRYLTEQELIHLPLTESIEKIIGYNPKCLNNKEVPLLAVNKSGFSYVFKSNLFHCKFKDVKNTVHVSNNVRCVLNYNNYRKIYPRDDYILFITNDFKQYKYNILTEQYTLLDDHEVIGYRYYKQLMCFLPVLKTDNTIAEEIPINNSNIVYREDQFNKTFVVYESGNMSLL